MLPWGAGYSHGWRFHYWLVQAFRDERNKLFSLGFLMVKAGNDLFRETGEGVTKTVYVIRAGQRGQHRAMWEGTLGMPFGERKTKSWEMTRVSEKYLLAEVTTYLTVSGARVSAFSHFKNTFPSLWLGDSFAPEAGGWSRIKVNQQWFLSEVFPSLLSTPLSLLYWSLPGVLCLCTLYISSVE